MVQLVEVEDEHFQSRQPGPEEEDDDFTDTGSSPCSNRGPRFYPFFLDLAFYCWADQCLHLVLV